MKKVLIIAGAVSALALASTPAAAAPVTANANAQAKIFRPLQLVNDNGMDFGTIVIAGTSFAAETVSLSQAGAITACGGGTNLVCSGTTTAADFTVTGTNNQTVALTVPATVSLSGSNGGTLTLTTNAPATVALGASGNAGVPFGVGGSIDIDSATVDGVYTGNFDVTADYQ